MTCIDDFFERNKQFPFNNSVIMYDTPDKIIKEYKEKIIFEFKKDPEGFGIQNDVITDESQFRKKVCKILNLEDLSGII